jgi:hypothetical protein
LIIDPLPIKLELVVTLFIHVETSVDREARLNQSSLPNFRVVMPSLLVSVAPIVGAREGERREHITFLH